MISSEENTSKVKEVWGKIKAGVKVTPTMVFSVVGDSDSFVPRPWPKTVFQTALIEAAKSGGETWILHRGKDHGVSKVVREAYQNYGVMEFEFKNSKITIEKKERHVKLISIARGGTQETKIDPTIYNTEDEESENFLLQFEKYVSEQEVSFFSQKMDFRMPVPIAIIVCEGDLETIAHIADALQNKLPVIIMKGSGKAADLIVDYLQSSKSLRKKASVLFGIRFDDTSYTTLHEYLMTIRRNRDLVGVFDLNKDDPLKLSNIIGEAVVSCWSIANILPTTTKSNTNLLRIQNNLLLTFLSISGSSSLVNTLAIAGSSVAWKLLKRKVIRPEVRAINQLLEGYKDESRSYVLNPKYTSPASLPLYFYFGYQLLHESKHMKASGHILLLEALKANRCDYVRVLLDQGVEFKKESLPELYDQTVSCKECKINEEDCLHMQWILMQIEESQANILCNEYRGLRANGNENNKEEIGNLHISVAESAKYLCRKIWQYKEDRSPFDQMNTNGDHISDILLWAIFANRKELAEICWLRSENQLLTGLVCSAILKKLAKKANNVKEQILSTDLAEHAALLEKRCLNIMDRMYEENTTHAIEVMDDEAVVWGIHSSPLTFAYENFMYDVVAHVCSQKNMNKQWYNNLTPDLKPFLKSAFTRPKAFITAPLTKFVFNYMMFFTMLVMYSAFILTSIDTKYYVQDIARVFEYYVYFWGGGDFIEELISCFGCLESRGRSHRGNYSRMKRYLYDFWNVVDLLSYALLISALFVRHFYTSETFTIARRMFSLSLLVMYLRFMEVFLIHRTLGPTLIMIKEMLKDLFNFLFIAVFVILGVGIYYHANLFPDHQTIWEGDWTEWSFWKIIYYPYWQLYAELNLEFLEGKSDEICTNVTSEWESGLMERCPQKDWTVSGITGVYLLFSNLLLVNLVIAMFSYTFERVQENSEKLWRFERYTVINDYDWRIPSPINIMFLPYRFLCCPTREDCCLQKCRRIHCPDKVKKEKGKKKEAVDYRRNFQKIIAHRIHNHI
ncbi:transient receptor potential cation channel subfamily M member 2-like [Crassostrea virginica]